MAVFVIVACFFDKTIDAMDAMCMYGFMYPIEVVGLIEVIDLMVIHRMHDINGINRINNIYNIIHYAIKLYVVYRCMV